MIVEYSFESAYIILAIGATLIGWGMMGNFLYNEVKTGIDARLSVALMKKGDSVKNNRWILSELNCSVGLARLIVGRDNISYLENKLRNYSP